MEEDERRAWKVEEMVLMVELRVIAGLEAREDGGVERESLEDWSDSEEGEVEEDGRWLGSRVLKVRGRMWLWFTSCSKGEAKETTSTGPPKPSPSCFPLTLDRPPSISIALP